jgi:hypothetical protein
MMIDARVAPKVRSLSPFGTIVCNVNHINAMPQLLPEVGATQERTLEVVSCRQLFDDDLGQQQLFEM